MLNNIIIAFRLIFISVLIFISIPSVTQERISEIQSHGDDYRYVLKEINGVRYLLSIDKFDVLKVYQFNGENLEFLHSRKFEGLQFDHEYHTTDHYLVFENGKGGFAYNFVLDIIKEFPFPSGFTYNFWSVHNKYKDQLILTQASLDFELQKMRFINLETNDEIILDDHLGYQQSSHFIYQRNDVNQDLENHIFLNKQTLEIDSFQLSKINTGSSIVDSIYHIYLDNDTFRKRNLISNEVETLYNITEDYTYTHIESFKNNYLIRLWLSSNQYKIVIINKFDFQVKTTNVIDYVTQIFPEIIENKLIYYDHTDLYIYNLDNHNLSEFYTFSNDVKLLKIVDQQFLIFPQKKVGNNEFLYTIGVYDLINESAFEITLPIDSPYEKLEFVKISEDRVLLNFDDENGDKVNLFELNLNSQNAQESSKYKYSKKGLSENSELFKVKNDVLVYSDGIYNVENGPLVKLNIHPLHEVKAEPFKLRHDHITWVEKITQDQFRFVKFQNGDIISSQIMNFQSIGVTGYFFDNYSINYLNNVYIVIKSFSFDYKMYVLENNQVHFLQNVLDSGSSTTHFISHGEYVYYRNGTDILIFDKNHSTSNIWKARNVFGEHFFTVGDQLYFDAEDGLYTIDGLEYNQFVEYQNGGPNPEVLRYPGGLILILMGNGEIGRLVDGEVKSLGEVNLEFSKYLGNDFLETNENVSINTFRSTIYNLNSDIDFKLPDSIELKRQVGVFKINNQLLLLTNDGYNGQSRMNLFKTNEDFTEFELIHQFLSSSAYATAEFINCESQGFLYADDELFMIDSFYNVQHLNETLVGDPNMNQIVELHGYFYFIAIDSDYGRQLYREISCNEYNEENDPDENNQELEDQQSCIFPNPVLDELNIKTDSEVLINAEFIVYDVRGRKVGSWQLGELENTIDVTQLISAPYFFRILKEDGSFFQSGKFIKISK